MIEHTETHPVKFCAAGVLASGGIRLQSAGRYNPFNNDVGKVTTETSYCLQYGRSFGCERCRGHLCTGGELGVIGEVLNTYSKISISPPHGQFAPLPQTLGHCNKDGA
jgi:hypothetical protein